MRWRRSYAKAGKSRRERRLAAAIGPASHLAYSVIRKKRRPHNKHGLLGHHVQQRRSDFFRRAKLGQRGLKLSPRRDADSLHRPNVAQTLG